MKILSTLGIVVLYFLVAVGVISTIEFAFTLMNKPDTLLFVGGLGLLIVTLFFIVAIVMHIISEYKQSNLYKTWQKKVTGKSIKKKENKKN